MRSLRFSPALLLIGGLVAHVLWFTVGTFIVWQGGGTALIDAQKNAWTYLDPLLTSFIALLGVYVSADLVRQSQQLAER